jgi:hypothetical protein
MVRLSSLTERRSAFGLEPIVPRRPTMMDTRHTIDDFELSYPARLRRFVKFDEMWSSNVLLNPSEKEGTRILLERGVAGWADPREHDPQQDSKATAPID